MERDYQKKLAKAGKKRISGNGVESEAKQLKISTKQLIQMLYV